jgi:regulator of sigma E protease
MSSLTIRMLVRMLSGAASSENLSGPVSIARYAGESAKLGVIQFALFLAVLSVSLGVLNLLPIPVLDGGHLLYFVIEAIKGSPVSETVMQWGQQVGLGIIAVLMALAFYNDILSLLS